MSANDLSDGIRRLEENARQQSVAAYFMLIDLADSTQFKMRHPELQWVVRLRDFYDRVSETARKIGHCKFLGDGVLVSSFETDHQAGAIRDIARKILADLNSQNAHLRGEYALTVRIVLSYGTAYMFDGNDPQGVTVDKIFRMEKLVPNGCIGMTDDFAQKLGLSGEPIARFPLRGLPGNHGLHLAEPGPTDQVIEDLIIRSYATSLWWLPGSDVRRVSLVGGHLEEAIEVPIGDVDAKLRAFQTLASTGRFADRISFFDDHQFPDSELTTDIVAVGGPCVNQVTNKLLADLDGRPVYFADLFDPSDETPLIDQRNKGTYRKEYTDGGKVRRLSRDWGLFVRCKNPKNRNRRVIVACGIESPAVDGIVRAFSPSSADFRPLMEKVMSLSKPRDGELIPDFYCIMPFVIHPNGRAAMPIFEDQIARLYPLN